MVDEISSSTELSYRRAVSTMEMGTPRIGCKSTHQHLRSALIWYHKNAIREIAMAHGWPSCDFAGLELKLAPHLGALDILQPIAPERALIQSCEFSYRGLKKTAFSKRRALASLPPDWREQMIGLVDIDERLPLVLLAVTGCRPSEIAKGVEIRRQGKYFLVGIIGSKVRGENGQPFRVLQINAKHAWGKRLAECLEDESEVIRYQERVRILQHKIARIARRWKQSMGISGYQISSYSFRHQLAADLKHLGEPPIWISAVLGHRSTRTASCYGAWSQGSGEQGAVIKTVAVMHSPRQWQNKFHAVSTTDHRIVIIPKTYPVGSVAESSPQSQTVATSSQSRHNKGNILS
jgi:hypothetical protein